MQNKEASPSGKRFAFFVAVACVPVAGFAWLAGHGYQHTKVQVAPSVPAVPAAAGAAWSLGGRWALRDYLRIAGAIGVNTLEDPWEVRPSGDVDSDRRLAIERGLRAHGYDVEQHNAYTWPRWATLAYFNTDHADEVVAVRMLAESGQAVQDAVCAAYDLGGNEAVEGFVVQLLAEHRAQEELTGRTNRPEETA